MWICCIVGIVGTRYGNTVELIMEGLKTNDQHPNSRAGDINTRSFTFSKPDAYITHNATHLLKGNLSDCMQPQKALYYFLSQMQSYFSRSKQTLLFIRGVRILCCSSEENKQLPNVIKSN